jgi:hypothetical protein
MNGDAAAEVSKKLNVLISLAIKQLLQEKSFGRDGKRRAGVSDVVHFLADMGLDAKDISEIVGSPITSVRTLLTPTRRR